jgi:hypothetical protein
MGCGSSHLCLYWCWDILSQIGDLIELWNMVQKFPNANGYWKYSEQKQNLHVYRNSKNHISKNQNGKHTYCFLIHLN